MPGGRDDEVTATRSFFTGRAWHGHADLRTAAEHIWQMCALVLDELFAGGVRAQVAAGAVTHSEGDRAPHVELIVTRLVRVFVRSPEGRTVTVRYCRPSALLGEKFLYNDHFTMPAPTQALVDSSVLRMRPGRAGALATRDERMAGLPLVSWRHRLKEVTGDGTTKF